MKVELISYTPNPDKLVAAAAKLCYAKSDIDTLMDKLTPEKVEEFLKLLGDLGHESPIEHASFTFGIEGVSRTLLAQLTRHRIASFSVQSQRYVEKNHFSYITPPEIAAIPEAKELFEKTMAQDAEVYERLRALLVEKHTADNLKAGMEPSQAAYAAGKKANEDARFVLPNACDTRIIMTMNVRSLHNFFRLRCCNRAQWEIRELAIAMLKLCRQAAPLLFSGAGPSCLRGGCSEGAMSCGQAADVRRKFKNIETL
jgi:thymidylate synthase (FAD)